MKRAILMLVLASGCAASVTNVRGPDGTPHVAIDCSGAEQCYEAAAAACPSGYSVADSRDRLVATEKVANTRTMLLLKCHQPVASR